MGGSALSIPTRRMGASEFHVLASRLSQSLSKTLAGARVVPIPAYHTKADFGDLDLIVEWAAPRQPNDPLPEILMKWTRANHAREHAISGHVASFDWRETAQDSLAFQVDLILTAPEHVDTSLTYFAYNDLGNFIGNVARRMGFVYGHKGLLLSLNDGKQPFATIEVSRDPPAILSFLGYDPVRFAKGFETLPDVFAYVASGAYFHPAIFSERQNNAARRQVFKRPTHRLFHEWLQAAHPAARHTWAAADNAPAKQLECARFLGLAAARFPHAAARWQEARENREQEQEQSRREAKERARLDGHLVSTWTGLKGVELGRLLDRLRAELGPPAEATRWLSDRTDLEIQTWVMDHLRPMVRRPSP